ncbi:hypothetical protein KFE25_011236 [Diacronema lutheri]|uniref:Nucleotide-diphospho-sugar transferase domain-containing protein n=1 Tax=Diacronema lutheri TaxID=2081491 RepID=A0A8J6C808_DIALT|nr:hypothetical protein KFE25_011236 [Diacronema lutheri]
MAAIGVGRQRPVPTLLLLGLPAFAAAPPRFAVVTTVVSRPCDLAVDRICRAHHTQTKIAALAYKLGCQLSNVGYAGPKAILMHGVYAPSSMAMLAAQGWRVHNVTADLRALFPAGVPGRARPALQIPPRRAGVVQPRNDGWATLYKLYAWSLVEFELVLHTDLDVVFSASPEPAIRAALATRLVFQALPEEAYRGYHGLNTHIMLLRPNTDVFSLLMTNAVRGHFVPFTRTEQDVLETVFPPEVGEEWGANGTAVRAVPWPHHKHWGPDADKAICRRHAACCPAPNEQHDPSPAR